MNDYGMFLVEESGYFERGNRYLKIDFILSSHDFYTA